MKVLFIDTHDELLTVDLVIDGRENKKEVESINSHSVMLLPLIDSMLKEENISLRDINKIVVVNGPGSFTGVRIGLTVAKTIGYALNIPVCPISSLEAYLISNDKISFKSAFSSISTIKYSYKYAKSIYIENELNKYWYK